MRLDLGQGQLGDLPVEGLEAVVLGDPGLHLREQILGDIHRARFPVLLAGQVMAGMAGSSLAVTAGTTASFVNRDEAGGQDGTAGLEFLGAGLEVARDQGGVFGDDHGWEEPVSGLASRISIDTYPKCPEKSDLRRKVPEDLGQRGSPKHARGWKQRGGSAGRKCEKSAIPQSCNEEARALKTLDFIGAPIRS